MDETQAPQADPTPAEVAIGNRVTIDRHTAIVAMRSLSQIWSDHVGLDEEVLAAIEELERVTGVQLNLKHREVQS